MKDSEYYNNLLKSVYATSSFSDIANRFPSALNDAIKEAFDKPKVVSKKAWNTLCSWVAELIIIDGKQVDIGYSNRDKSEIRITIQNIGDVDTADVYRLSKDDVGVAVLPRRILEILRDVWNQKELERCKSDSKYFINRNTYIIGADPYKK